MEDAHARRHDAPLRLVGVANAERAAAEAALHVGHSARDTPDGHNPLTGKVTWVSREAEYTPRNVQTREERVTQVFAVKIVLQGDTSQLKDGMWADIDLL